jgi:putative spermidine/putrescine transport system permease protein
LLQPSQSKLALPLAVLFAVFFVAPLCVLLAISLFGEPEMKTLTGGAYVKFFSDGFNLSILWGTLLLGVKATLVCLLFGYPIAWVSSRASPRWQSVLLFIVILPIMTSVVVRTFSWIVILGRQGILNQIALGLGLTDEPLKLLFTETGVVIVLAQVQMPLMVLPILTRTSLTPLGRSVPANGARCGGSQSRCRCPACSPGASSPTRRA